MSFERLGFVLLLAVLLLAAYAAWIAPRRLSVTRLDVFSPELPPGFEGRVVVQFSDTHLHYAYSLKRFARLVDAINALRPDLVAFTGDLFDGRACPAGDPAVIPLLARIEAPLGKFAVYGNHDFGRDRLTRTSGAFLGAGGFAVLVNETRTVASPGSGDTITVSGLDDCVRGRPDPQAALGALPEDGFHLLLAHEPDPAPSYAAYPVDLQLSGHSHGGQVALPLVGALIRTPYGRRYVRGLFAFRRRTARTARADQADRKFYLYVNRGIGTTRLPFRFGSRPELTAFALRRGPSRAETKTT